MVVVVVLVVAGAAVESSAMVQQCVRRCYVFVGSARLIIRTTQSDPSKDFMLRRFVHQQGWLNRRRSNIVFLLRPADVVIPFFGSIKCRHELYSSTKQRCFSSYNPANPEHDLEGHPEQKEQQQHKPTKIKPWLDVRISLNERIQEFFKAHTIHKADLHAVEMRQLLELCCKKSNLEGMDEAHGILERLFVEKRKHQKDDPNAEYSVDQSFVNTVMFGWVNLATKLRVAMVRMRELLDMAIDEAKHDAKVNPSINKFGTVTVQT
jgi:hypothetical protein